jgi:hypothetical protein
MFTPAIITAVTSLDATRRRGEQNISRSAWRRRRRFVLPFRVPRISSGGALQTRPQ